MPSAKNKEKKNKKKKEKKNDFDLEIFEGSFFLIVNAL